MTLPCIEVNPPTAPNVSIIWLHGLGADGHDFVPIVPELHLPPSLGIRFVFPHAPVMPITLNQGYAMRAWFDISELSNDASIDTLGIEKSVHHLHELIKTEKEKYKINPSHILLAGFSQGAVIALTTGLCYPEPLAGLIALSGYLPNSTEVLKKSTKENRQTPIFIAHGTQDTIIPYARSEASYAALKQTTHPISWHSYAMPHSVCAEEVADLSTWIQSIKYKGHTA